MQDKRAVLEFIQNLKARRVCDGRIERYVFHLRTIREHLDCNFKQTRRNDIESFTVWLNPQDYAADAVADFGMMPKRFYKFLKFGNLDKDTHVPEEVRWISTAVKPNDKKQPKFLTPQEEEKLIMAADCLRDKAMIAIGFEGGFRACGLLRMNIGSVSFDEKGAVAKVSAETGQLFSYV